MVDFPKFFTTAAELYGLWPSFFNWAAGLIIPILGAIVTVTWWMRGYKADGEKASLEADKATLQGEIRILQQRLALATEQQNVANEESRKFKSELDELKGKIDSAAPTKDIQMLTTNLDVTLGRLLTANNATTSTLTFQGTGYRDFKVVEFGPKREQ